MDTDTILLNLKIISKIQENDRIARGYEDNTIVLDGGGIFQWLTRTLHRDNRTKGINDIKCNVNAAIEKTKGIMNSKFFNAALTYSDELRDLKNIQHELSNCLYGLENLKRTYIQDENATSRIDLIIHRINSHLLLMDESSC